MDNTQTEHRLIPLVNWPAYHPWPSVSALRWYTFHAERTGFAKVIRKVGKRVLIDERAFFEWVEDQNLGGIS